VLVGGVVQALGPVIKDRIHLRFQSLADDLQPIGQSPGDYHS